jgi:hypothetical protein
VKGKQLQSSGFKIAWMVVLALATLATMGVSVPHRNAPVAYIAPWASSQCVDNSQVRFDQYLAAIQWAAQGSKLAAPAGLSVSCDEGNLARFAQYQSAIESTAQEFAVVATAPTLNAKGSMVRFAQYLAATEQSVRASTLELERFMQYSAALESAGQ